MTAYPEIGACVAGFAATYWLVGEEGNTNMDEAGEFSPWYKSTDAAKWVVPTQTHLNLISQQVIFSKQRAFIVSEVRDQMTDEYIGCYFPLAANGSTPTSVNGAYWSTTRQSDYNGYHLSVVPAGVAAVTYLGKGTPACVRCVRDVSADELNSSTAR